MYVHMCIIYIYMYTHTHCKDLSIEPEGLSAARRLRAVRLGPEPQEFGSFGSYRGLNNKNRVQGPSIL